MTLKEYRTAKGLTQKELAEELKEISPGIDRVMVSKIENGIVAYPVEVEQYIIDQCAHTLIGAPRLENDENDKYIDCRDEDAISGDLELRLYAILKDLIPQTRATRQYLAKTLGVSDRKVRLAIERLRSRGVRICSGGSSAGYYLAKTEVEYRYFEKEYLSRAFKVLANARAMRNNNVGQLKL